MTEELIPCPFCGGEASVRAVDYPDGDRDHVFSCNCGRKLFDLGGKAEAIVAWNTRATLGSGKLTAEQVRDAIEQHGIASIGCRWQFVDRSYQAIADELNATIGGGR